ncbi:hypothetical protein ABOM_005648 [Aspergillus bombycis]|uniref:DAPG hydrolase PhiG domain-containing protein n=1 Tax=Aspergillus bombycis TaxID=109264 RepID=A0A1F8A3Z9_9EURO|nr:hypothetical protein ABOM_005648 [Aspergillus bombycis]OGM46085.1 hypothetical protein ABOM_005648 [Aspergillus bombycis]
MVTILPAPYGLSLKDASLLLTHEYLPLEAGVAHTADGMIHIAASTYMKGCTGAMLDWWFGWVHTTQQYQLWHPRDHVFSDWEGPRGNGSEYIGGHHLVEEYIGGELASLKISFRDPEVYFGPGWQAAFNAAGYATAVCARVGQWNRTSGQVVYVGHLIHLVKEEPDGVRMRSRFWLGDVEEGVAEGAADGAAVSGGFALGLLRHATEEMAILATILPDMYTKYAST